MLRGLLACDKKHVHKKTVISLGYWLRKKAFVLPLNFGL